MTNEPLAQQPSGSPSGAPSLADLLARPAPSPVADPSDFQGCANEVEADNIHKLPTADNAALRSKSAVTLQLASRMNAPLTQEAVAPAQAHQTPAERIPLLVVHAASAPAGLLQNWLLRVLEGGHPFVARGRQSVAEQVQYLQPQAVLIQFEPTELDTAVELAAQLQAQFPHLPRVAIGHSKDSSTMFAALRAGVQDFLDLDGSLEAAQFTVQQLLQRAPVSAPDQPRAPLTAIVSARAGLGCSLLTSHLSWHLQQRLSPSSTQKMASAANAEDLSLEALLIELGNSGGDCAIYLNTPGDFGFLDAVSHQRRLDKRMAHSALSRHASGLRLLTMARQGRVPLTSDVEALLKRLSQYFRHVLVDLGATTTAQLQLDVLNSANDIWLVCDQSVSSVVWSTELLKRLDAAKIPRERVQLIVNRHDSRLDLAAAQIAQQLQLPLLEVIPERRRELAHAVNQGGLLPATQKREPYVQAIDKLVATLLAQHHPELASQEVTTTGPLHKLLQRIRRN